MITLNPDEKIYLIKRRHRVVLMKVLVPEIFIFFLIIVGMIILFFVPLHSWPEMLVGFLPEIANYNLGYLLLFLLSLLLSIFWMVIFLIFINYYLDCWIVTDQRTIHTELRGLFSRIFSSVYHNRIQDITIEIHGILPFVFRFGDLHIQTAGGFRAFVFRQIPDPHKTKEIIFKCQKEFLESQRKSEENQRPVINHKVDKNK